MSDCPAVPIAAYSTLDFIDSEGNLVISNDDASGSDLNSYVSLTLPTEGVYTVVATSFDPLGSGGYRLTMRNFSAPRATAPTVQSGLEPVFNPLALVGIGLALNELFFSSGGGSDDTYDPTQDPATREASRVRRPTPQPAPPPVPAIDPFYE